MHYHFSSSLAKYQPFISILDQITQKVLPKSHTPRPSSILVPIFVAPFTNDCKGTHTFILISSAGFSSLPSPAWLLNFLLSGLHLSFTPPTRPLSCLSWISLSSCGSYLNFLPGSFFHILSCSGCLVASSGPIFIRKCTFHGQSYTGQNT